MKKALIDLWNGNNIPLSHNLKQTDEEKELIGYLEKHHSDIYARLDDDGKESLKKFEDCYSELIMSECETAFAEGFSLATKLISAALT